LQTQFVTATEPTAEDDAAGHSTHELTPAAEYVPAPQLMHATLPLVFLKVPAAHGEQVPPFGPVYPALQVHAVTAELVLGEFVFTGHTKQADATVAPTVPEYFPAKQPVHDALPLKSLYVPAPHASHGPPFGPVYPALQVHAVATELMLGALELSEHARQVVAAVAPAVEE
jgi:hypothetical protein